MRLEKETAKPRERLGCVGLQWFWKTLVLVEESTPELQLGLQLFDGIRQCYIANSKTRENPLFYCVLSRFPDCIELCEIWIKLRERELNRRLQLLYAMVDITLFKK